MIPASDSATHYLLHCMVARNPRNLAATAETMLAAGADVLIGPSGCNSLDLLVEYARRASQTKVKYTALLWRYLWPLGHTEHRDEERSSRLKELRKIFKLFVDSMPGSAESMKALISTMMLRRTEPWNAADVELKEFRGPMKMLKLQRTFVRKLVEWGRQLPNDNPDRAPLLKLILDQIPHWLIEGMRMTRLRLPKTWTDEQSNTKEGRDSFFLRAAEKLAVAYQF